MNSEKYSNLYDSFAAVYVPPNLDPATQKEAYAKAETEFEDHYIREVREVSNYFKTAKVKAESYIALFEGANQRESLILSGSSTQIGNVTVTEEPKLLK